MEKLHSYFPEENLDNIETLSLPELEQKMEKIKICKSCNQAMIAITNQYQLLSEFMNVLALRLFGVAGTGSLILQMMKPEIDEQIFNKLGLIELTECEISTIDWLIKTFLPFVQMFRNLYENENKIQTLREIANRIIPSDLFYEYQNQIENLP